MPESYSLSTHQGAALLAQGRFDEAISLFRHQAALYPYQVSSWTALANSLVIASRSDAAIIAYDAALRIDPLSTAALCGKARILQTQSQVAAARALFEEALHTEASCPEASLGLAKLAIEEGDWTNAEAWAEKLSLTAPGAEQAWLAARIALGRGDMAGAERRLRTLLTDFPLDSLQRADALLMLSAALDATSRYEEAFASASEGKKLQRRFYAERAAGRETELAKMARLNAWFKTCDPTPWLEHAAPLPIEHTADQHVFLLGFPRSGTTLLEQVLAAHPMVQALEEAPTLAAPYAEFLTTSQGLQHLSSLCADEQNAWRARYWSDVKRFGSGVRPNVFIDKNPAGSLYLPLIAKLFPNALVLFAVRDPRDVVWSCFRNNFQINAMTYAFTDLADTAACYDACMEMVTVYRRVLPLNLMEVRHEALVADFDGVLARVCNFVGVDVTPEMADVATTTRRRVVRTPSAPQLREGLNTKGVGRWRKYEAELQPVLPILDRWVTRFGHDRED
jgi:tetratricopeptide (TPR) repeat protein